MRDTLNRRKRYHAPELDVERDGRVLRIQERDERLFLILQTHGMLPLNYLAAFTGSSEDAMGDRLRKLWAHGYLIRPDAQRLAEKSKGQYLTYDLAERAITHLEVKGWRDRYTHSFKGHPVHQFATACYTASIEMAATRASVTYISQEDILSSKHCIRRSLALPFKRGVKVGEEDAENSVVPDQIFGLRFSDGAERYYAVETELAAKDSKRYKAKLAPYDTIISGRIFQKEWGIPNLRVLVIGVSQHRVELMKEQMEDITNKSHFLFSHNPHFAFGWNVPPILFELFDKPHQTTGQPFYINRP